MMLRLLSLLILLAILTACGPLHTVKYTYVPPQASMEKKCASQCAKGKRYCQEICQLKHPNCFAKAYQHALTQYERYRQACIRKGERVIKTLRDFDQSYSCYNACNCVPSFNTCYTACGGQVIEG